MDLAVVHGEDGYRLRGSGPEAALVNRFLGHLKARAFSPATVQAYAYDLLNFARFLHERRLTVGDGQAPDLFDYPDWQARPRPTAGRKVVRLAHTRGAAPATMNRRMAAVRALFEFLVVTGHRPTNPVPAPRRASGLRAPRRGLLGHLGPGRPRRGGRLIR